MSERKIDRRERNKYRNRDKRWGQPYRKSRSFDKSCRCHGGCPYCESGRLRYRRLGELQAIEELNEAGVDLFIVRAPSPEEQERA